MSNFNSRHIKLFLLLIFTYSISSCGGGGGGGGGSDNNISSNGQTPIPNASVSGCFVEDYADASSSEYILPYQIGTAHRIEQGNCGSFSTHRPNCVIGGNICGDLRYAYDFSMPIGTVILAARGGKVILISDSSPSSGNPSNIMIIEHDDGTLGRYLHIAQSSSFFVVDDLVNQGDPITMSGASGTGSPHLHFDVLDGINANCNATAESGCITVPVEFRNANPIDVPLIENRTYNALIF